MQINVHASVVYGVANFLTVAVELCQILELVGPKNVAASFNSTVPHNWSPILRYKL